MTRPVKIIIVDDHNLILDGLASLIKSIEGFELMGSFNAVPALNTFLKESEKLPDLFILDVELPGIDGIQAAKDLKEKFPEAKVLMLTMHDESYFINRAILAGANGYLLKNATRASFQETVTRVMNESEFICKMTSKETSTSPGTEEEKKITVREMHILKLVAQGKSSKDIASALFISNRTVDTHRNNLKRKLGLQTSGELVRYAFDHGYL